MVNSRTLRTGALLLVLLSALVLTRPSRAMQAAQYTIRWRVIGAGGCPAASAAYRLNGTAG